MQTVETQKLAADEGDLILKVLYRPEIGAGGIQSQDVIVPQTPDYPSIQLRANEAVYLRLPKAMESSAPAERALISVFPEEHAKGWLLMSSYRYMVDPEPIILGTTVAEAKPVSLPAQPSPYEGTSLEFLKIPLFQVSSLDGFSVEQVQLIFDELVATKILPNERKLKLMAGWNTSHLPKPLSKKINARITYLRRPQK